MSNLTETEELIANEFRYVHELRKLRDHKDIEYLHWKADSLLCELLTELGYGRVVEEYGELTRWYA